MIDRLFTPIWDYVKSPFILSRLMELLFALTWVWHAFLSLLPDKYRVSRIINFFQEMSIGHPIGSILLWIIGISSLYAIIKNVVWLRRVIILFNIGILIAFSTSLIIKLPINGSAGFLVILIILLVVAFWRMEETY